jgi:hypothetical protein
MIGTRTETDIEISEPIVVDERRIFTVSEKRSITIPKVGGVAAVRVSPLYVLVLEGNSCYGYSVNKTELLDLEVLFRNEPAIREEFLNVSRMSSDSLNIIRNENRVPDLYSALPSIIIKGIKSMSTFESEKDQNQHEHHREMEDVRKQIMTVGNQLHEYLEGIHAEVENYKFSVEKHGEGIEVEIQLKAFVRPKSGHSVQVIPK